MDLILFAQQSGVTTFVLTALSVLVSIINFAINSGR